MLKQKQVSQGRSSLLAPSLCTLILTSQKGSEPPEESRSTQQRKRLLCIIQSFPKPILGERTLFASNLIKHSVKQMSGNASWKLPKHNRIRHWELVASPAGPPAPPCLYCGHVHLKYRSQGYLWEVGMISQKPKPESYPWPSSYMASNNYLYPSTGHKKKH